MQITTDDQKRSAIEAHLAQFTQAIKSLRKTFKRITELGNLQTNNLSVLSELTAIDDPSDKQIQQLLICRERAAILRERDDQSTATIAKEKREVVQLSDEAMELVRGAASKQLFDKGEADTKASLPPAIKRDPHLVFKIWNEGAEKRRIGMFLNPPALTRNEDPEVILDEAKRRADLLDDLLQGRDIFPESQTAGA